MKSVNLNKKIEAILPLTDEQRPALDFEMGNCLVSAGAGSGKTRVLIARFAELVLAGRASVKEILAITFTEKAASEMKYRLIDVFERAKREDLRREVEEAYVATMHSFASRLLREYALEIGVDPDYQVIAEDEKAALENEVWEALLDGCGDSDEVYSLLLDFKSKESLKDELLNLRSQLSSFGLKNINDLMTPEAAILERKKEIRSLIEAAAVEMKKSSDLSKTEREVYQGLLMVIRELNGSGADATLIKEAGKFTMRGKRVEWQPMLKEVKELMVELLLLEKEAETLERRNNFVALLDLFNEQLDLRKSEQGFLDYDDLLLKLLNFLKRNDRVATGIQSELRNKFRYILMDELQDSNSIEMKILKELSNSKNLFLVGDAKQSIYAFRQADVDIFLNLEHGACRMTHRESKEGMQLIRLQDNYRSRHEILNFVNDFFGSEIFKGSKINYQPLKFPSVKPVEENDEPRVECVIASDTESEDPVKKDLRQIWEADAICERLIQLKHSDFIPDLKFGEVALLLKNFTDVSVYEQAFRRKGIPYSVVAGRGFYQKSEVLDLLGILKIIENPFDDIALIGVLRSPLVGFSDDGLMLLSQVRDRAAREKGQAIALWSGFWGKDFLKILSVSDRKAVITFVDLYEALQAKKNKVLISELIREVILKTDYDSKVLIQPDGKRKFANIEKLIELARGFDSKNLGLSSFLGHLSEMTVKEVRESEAQIDDQDKENVQIMTVHKSKGLEFRVVVVADFDAGGRHSSFQFNYSKKWGLGSKREFPELGSKVVGDFRYFKNKEAAVKNREEEAKRLLYVACTRAKEYLILSSAPSSRGNLFLEQLCKYLECGSGEEGIFKNVIVNQVSQSTQKGEGLRCLSQDPAIVKGVASGRPFTLSTKKEKAPSLSSLLESVFQQITKRDLLTRDVVDTSVTYLMEKANQKGRVEDEMKVSELSKAEFEDETFEPELAGKDYGTLFHSLLEQWDFSRNSIEEYEKTKSNLSTLSIPAASRERLERELYLFAIHPLSDELNKARLIERELPFEWQAEKVVKVRGVIDLLYQGSDGVWHLLDYKTNQVETEAEVDEKVKYYKFQLSVYGNILMKVLKLKQIKCSLYFSKLGKLVSWDLEGKQMEDFQTSVVQIAKNS